MNLEQHLASELSLNISQVNAVLRLSADGATIPFIARYRKDSTGNLDEVAIEKILRLSADLQELEKRRSFILKTIEDLGELTDDLRKGIESAMDLPTLEDIYLPFKPKRKTRAEKAREKGLEGLAKILMAQNERDPNARAQNFLSDEVPTVEDALQGARDIIAEWINENPSIRQQLRQMFGRFAMIHSKVIKSKADEGVKYQDYFDFLETLKRCQSHRFLAMMRGEAEGFLRVHISPDEEQVLEGMEGRLVKGNGGSSDQVILAIKDAWKRLLQPSLETEFRQETKKRADEAAIHIFTENLRQLLLAPPLGEKRTLGIDPGFQSGCKL
ncbi:MAG: RNA-binding transcriptional accessory protein, partial [Bacteroidota bacterium]|nr:RNA-binding transcriptional accessory protein [Bacteroidota bacterium]